MRTLTLLALTLALPSAFAMPVKTRLVRAHAYTQDRANGLHEELDLKTKTLSFRKKDFSSCSPLITRTESNFEYVCSMPIPTKAYTSILQNLSSPTILTSHYDGKARDIQVKISADGRNLILKTTFDSTGVDGDELKFNDELSRSYARMGQLSFNDALSRHPIQMEVLEGP